MIHAVEAKCFLVADSHRDNDDILNEEAEKNRLEANFEMDSDTASQDELRSALSDVVALINSQQEEVAANLRIDGRSRIARQVLTLPCEDSKRISEAAGRDLPTCGRALGLASASSAVHLAKNKRFKDAVREADVAMVMLGLPDALSLRKVVDMLECHDLIRCDLALDRDAILGQDFIEEKHQLRDFLLGECAEHDAALLTLERFKEYFEADRPVVIRNCASHWPAVKKWCSPQYLCTYYGNRTVPVEWTSSGSGQMMEKFCTLSYVLEEMLRKPDEGNAAVYLAQHPLFDYIQTLAEDIEHPGYMEIVGKRQADLTNVWMGTAGSGSKLHFDSADNILVQVVGEKQVVLISPDQGNLLYRKSPSDNISPIDVELPDPDKYPLFGDVKGTIARLGPGDALYIPATHWHWVKAFTSSMSVNFWF